MVTSINELTPQILALNTAEKPFVYQMTGNSIIGSWNIVDAKWLNLMSAQQIQKDYQITFSLDEKSGVFDFVDNMRQSSSEIGGSGLSHKVDLFSGKQIGTKKGINIGFGVKDKDKPVQPVGVVAYDFNTADIKKPIIDLLQANGWKQKGGFLSKLFAR